MPDAEKIRLDKYLWSIRLYKTRSAAADACEKGRVKIDGQSLKASRSVKVGDVYDLRTETRRWVIRVESLLDHRVAYTEAVKHYTDLTPEEERERIAFQAAVFHTGKRQSKIGRPTKKDRRALDGLME